MHDFGVIGGGIIGVATAAALGRRFPRARILVLEKESRWGRHQTGRNSGVIHSGIYYRPGSVKARLARRGNRELVRFCREHGIRHQICGKVVVATRAEELPRLEALYQRGLANGVEVRRLSCEELQEVEPHARGVAAVYVPSAGIVSFAEVVEVLAGIIQERGAEVRLGTKVEGIAARSDEVTLETSESSYRVRFVINCAGLHSDRVARQMGVPTPVRIVPFRGEYYELASARSSLVRSLIYPVPDPRFPFLGVHLTRGVDGAVHAGPNAVLSWKREGYRRGDFDLEDAFEFLTYGGFWRLAACSGWAGLREMARSYSKRLFVRSLQRLVPEVRTEDLRSTTAGVRAQALRPDGQLLDDFLILTGTRSIHVCNAPSPGATACLPIGRAVARRVPEVGHVLN